MEQDERDKVLEGLKGRDSLGKEFFLFVRQHKAYWLVPLIALMAILAVLVFLGSTGAAPFIYTLF